MNKEMLEVLAPAYTPCRHFSGQCKSMRWNPSNGHVPRGFCGADGDLSEIELILVTAEPGDPLAHEDYSFINIEQIASFLSLIHI